MADSQVSSFMLMFHHTIAEKTVICQFSVPTRVAPFIHTPATLGQSDTTNYNGIPVIICFSVILARFLVWS